MKKYLTIIILFSSMVYSCKDEQLTIESMITDLEISPQEIYADTKTEITVKAILNSKLDKRNVIFKTSNGVFSKNNENEIIVEASFSDSILSATTVIKPLANPTDLKISAQIELTDLKDVFVKEKTVSVLSSEPSSIKIFSNSFSVENSFGNEIEITGILRNNNGKGVSQGHNVEIKCFDNNYNEFQGYFRNSNLSSNSNSEISTTYSPGLVEPNQFIYLIATVIDKNQNNTNIKDTIKVYITQKK